MRPSGARTFYSENVRTVPLWRALQLSAIALASVSLAGYWTMTSTAGEARRVAQTTPGTPPQFTMLLAGRDIAYCYYHTPCKDQNSPEARKMTNTDTIMLLRVSASGVNVLSIPRDTQAGEFRTDLTWSAQKVNASYSFGGPERLVQRVEEITGDRIDYYAVVKTTYVASVIDALGGLDVNVPEPGIEWIDNAANVNFKLSPGQHHLAGPEAVLYMRVRKGFGDDYGRMDHQKAAIAQLVGKLKSARGLAALPTLLFGFQEGVETNADPAMLEQMRPFLGDYALNFATLPTTEIRGTTNLAPDRAALARLWGSGAPTLVAQQKASVRIFDASGENLGQKLAWALKGRGYVVSNVEAQPAHDESSQVFTVDEVGSATDLASLLGLPRLQGLRFPVETGEVGVLLGRDALQHFAELAALNPPRESAHLNGVTHD
ncbi:LCP family protein [Deinococcus yavapaiensis]|uniref:LytR family transcriptional attenuator n=1 Tax=Deinococcus yavapaiensis KR-236 TaxID=694435 RepID=A0A318SP52_9DEIO|nr:LCP family protein [Deinococcus yavapaiensis]PYE54530.1 LytR family transcriptional attenuator [Deinococcus yavapaiensis KR-236]